ARLQHDQQPAASPDVSLASSSSLTQTGDVLGTVGYSPPEQWRGEPPTAASDQYSLCVSLHHAVEGVDPFTGNTVTSRLASVEAGTIIVGDDNSVPAWLRAAIARGLSAKPEDRHPSMAELIGELRRPRGWRKWRVPALAAVIASLSVGSTAAMLQAKRGDECNSGDGQLAAYWNPQMRERLLGVLNGLQHP